MSYLEMAKKAYAVNAEKKILANSSGNAGNTPHAGERGNAVNTSDAVNAVSPAELRPRAPTDAPSGSPLIAYRGALRQWWALGAQGAAADVVEVGRVYQEIVRLIDEVGEPMATAQRRAWARAWYAETGICPFCGERGPYHDPESLRHG